MKARPESIDELITFLQEVKAENGNLPIMGEYDASYFIGRTMEVRQERDPDDYPNEIKVLMIY